jgi:hypothetical protein
MGSRRAGDARTGAPHGSTALPTVWAELVVCYTGNAHNVLRYICVRGARDNGEPRCISFGGLVVDDAIGKEILRVVQPAAVDAAIVASEVAAHQQDEVLKAWTRELEAARYAARRAQKQYDAIDPENRLVADELERRWNTALQRVREIEERASIDTFTVAVSPWSQPETNWRIWQRASRPSSFPACTDRLAPGSGE